VLHEDTKITWCHLGTSLVSQVNMSHRRNTSDIQATAKRGNKLVKMATVNNACLQSFVSDMIRYALKS